MPLSVEEGERLIAHGHQRNVPAVVAGRLEQLIRPCCWLVLALQDTKITVRRLRRLLFGKALPASAPAPADASAPSPGGGDETQAAAVLDAAAGEGATTAGEALPQDAQRRERAKPKGGHRPGPGRLGADVYEGGERVECRPEELAVGQRCPICGKGTLYRLPPGGELRIDGNARLRAIR